MGYRAKYVGLALRVVNELQRQIRELLAQLPLDGKRHLLDGPIENDDDLVEVIEALALKHFQISAKHFGQGRVASNDNRIAGPRIFQRLPVCQVFNSTMKPR